MNEPSLIFNKTRIAPTPSGFIHLGNVLSFAVTAALAGQTNAKILLRIDDLDRERVQEKYVQDIFDTLDFMELPWHEGPRDVNEYKISYSQTHRMAMYREALQQLAAEGDVFACDCSRSTLNAAGQNYQDACLHKGLPLDATGVNWRLRNVPANALTVNTLTNGVAKIDLPGNMRHFVVRKKDGFPAYQLTSLLDDIYFGTNLVVRGDDLWPSTLAQLYLATILNHTGFLETTFHHHRLLAAPGGQKLSKSAGATAVRYLRQQGKKRADVYAEIARMAGIKEQVSNWAELAAYLL